MGSETENGQDWVARHIETRVKRGTEWHNKIADHKKLARATTPSYIRILGGGFRPVSISDENPCGHLLYKESDKQIHECKSIEGAILKAATAQDGHHSGNKPEHQIQAFIIRQALLNKFEFGRIDQLFPDFKDEFDKLFFITDELAVKRGKDKKECRADIVALGGKGGRYFPVFIEIKIDRKLKKLIEQLTNAYDWLWRDDSVRVPFSEFLSEVSGGKVIDPDEKSARRMLIWSGNESGGEVPEVQEARNLKFLIAKYSRKDREYIFVRDTRAF